MLACCLGGLTGCADLVRTASKTAVPIVVSSGLGELATPQSQAQLKSIAASPAVQEAGYGVGLGIGRGILDEGEAFLGGTGSKSDEPAPAVGVAATVSPGGNGGATAGAPTTRPVGAGGNGGAKAVAATGPATGPAATQGAGGGPAKGMAFVQSTLTPVVGDLVRTAVREGMGQAMGTDGRAEVGALAETAGDRFVAGMTRAADRDAAPVLGRLVRDQVDPVLDDAARRLGPALHDVLQQQVEPVVRDLVAECVRDTLKMPVRPENAPDVVANARNVSEGASLVTHDALIGVGALDRSGQLSPRLRLALWGGVALAGLVGVAALVLLGLRILIAWGEWRRAPAARRAGDPTPAV